MNGEEVITTENAIRALLPFLESDLGGPLAARVVSAPLDQLRRFYLFSVSGLVLPQAEEDIPRYIERRFLSALSAAHRAKWTVITAIFGSSSGAKIQLGFMTESSSNNMEPYVFERILRGLLPGLGVCYEKNATIEPLLEGKAYGGIVAGVPTLKIDDERQRFNLPSVIRSLHGEDYALFIISRPIEDNELACQLGEVWKVRDNCHEMAKTTRTTEEGESESHQKTETIGESNVDSRIARAAAGFGTGAVAGGLAAGPAGALIGGSMGASLILMGSGQRTTSTSTTVSNGTESHWSKNLSVEEQNSVLLELEETAKRHAARLMKAANVGEWETAITFATRTTAGRDILAGSLLGELAKPSTEVFPPRIYYEDLNPSRPLLFPGLDQFSSVFPRSLASYLTGEELASISSPPAEQLPNYDIRRIPTLSLSDTSRKLTSEKRVFGSVCDHGRSLENVYVELSPEDLAKHLFVCGLTGSGKTTTVKELLVQSPVPFLVIESAKRDYRKLLGVDKLSKRLRIYTVGDSTIAPIRMNPFYVMPGVSPLAHIDFLKSIFNASFSLYGPMPYILEKCLYNVYLKRGWNFTTGSHPQLCGNDGRIDPKRYKEPEADHWFPTLFDLKAEVSEYVRSGLDYRGELSDNIRTAIVTRLESLSVGSKGMLFGTSKALDVADLLQHPTVLELESLSDDDDKAFFVGLMLTFISEYWQCNNPDLDPYVVKKHSTLNHLLVIEEAHRLLKNVVQERQTEQLGNPRGKAVEFFANVLSEMRSVGQGVIVVEQIPTKILPDVIKNTNAKLVHRLVTSDDQMLMASSLGLAPEESIYLTSLKTGHALYLKDGMQRPVEVKVNSNVSAMRIDHERVQKTMPAGQLKTEIEGYLTADVRNILADKGDEIALRTLCTIATCKVTQATKSMASAVSELNRALIKLDRTFAPAVIEQYLCDRLASFLLLGVFHLKGTAVNCIVKAIKSLAVGLPNAAAEVQKKLADGWESTSSRQGAIRRISELVLDRAIRGGFIRDNEEKIDQIASTYFLIEDPGVRREIVSKIVSRLGDQQWTR